MAAFGYQIWIFGAIIADFHFIMIEDLQALINHPRLMKMAVEDFSFLLIAEREEERLKNDRWECKKKKKEAPKWHHNHLRLFWDSDTINPDLKSVNHSTVCLTPSDTDIISRN